MMGQELFEHPKKQYKTYGITALEELSPRIGDPEAHLDDAASEEQVSAMEAVSYTHLTLPTICSV